MNVIKIKIIINKINFKIKVLIIKLMKIRQKDIIFKQNKIIFHTKIQMKLNISKISTKIMYQ